MYITNLRWADVYRKHAKKNINLKETKKSNSQKKPRRGKWKRELGLQFLQKRPKGLKRKG